MGGMYRELTIKQFGVGIMGLVSVGLFLFFFDLGKPAFLDYDEAQYAQVIKDTIESGDYLSLERLGVPWFDKPPLYFWLAMVTGSVFEDAELAYRIPSALFGLLGVLLTVAIARHVVGRNLLALAAGGALLTTGAYLQAARQVRLDVPIATTLLFSFYCFLRGTKDSRWYVLWGPGIALAVLLKSAVGTLGLLFVGVWAVGRRDFSFLRAKHFWYGAFLGLVLLVPWYAYETARHGMIFWNEHIFRHVFDRFNANILGGSASNWVYVRFGLEDMAPWTTVFLFGFVALFFNRDRSEERTKILTLGAIAAVVFAIFAMGKTKLFYYLVPAMPFVALFALLSVAHLLKNRPRLQVASVVVLLLGGLGNTGYVGFSLADSLSGVAARAEEERAVGTLIKEQGNTDSIRALMYPHWDTLIYYSGGLRVVELQEKESSTKPFGLVLPTFLYEKKPFSKETASKFTLAYKGQHIVLLYFSP